MLTDFNISMLPKDMKIAVQKNHLGGLFLSRSLDAYKKRGQRK